MNSARTILALACVGLFGAGAAAAFWWQDGQYSRPTPRPAELVQVAPGTLVAVPALASVRPAGDHRPVLLHFFNPHCPCSRFNVDHVRELQQDWGGRVAFVAVLQGVAPGDAERALRRAGLRMPVLADPNGRIAAACGVYSSPQAVLLDSGGRLYFRGNYNVSRYCTESATEFARLAMDSLAHHAPPPSFGPASVAYGCELPSWKRHRG